MILCLNMGSVAKLVVVGSEFHTLTTLSAKNWLREDVFFLCEMRDYLMCVITYFTHKHVLLNHSSLRWGKYLILMCAVQNIVMTSSFVRWKFLHCCFSWIKKNLCRCCRCVGRTLCRPGVVDVMCRPFFTYWVTFVQIVCFIISVVVFGIATISGAMTTVSGEVLLH